MNAHKTIRPIHLAAWTILAAATLFTVPASANVSNGGHSAELKAKSPLIDKFIAQYEDFYDHYTAVDTSGQIDEYPWISEADATVDANLDALNAWDMGNLVPTGVHYDPIQKGWVVDWNGGIGKGGLTIVFYDNGGILIAWEGDNGSILSIHYHPDGTIIAIIIDANKKVSTYILTPQGWKKIPNQQDTKFVKL